MTDATGRPPGDPSLGGAGSTSAGDPPPDVASSHTPSHLGDSSTESAGATSTESLRDTTTETRTSTTPTPGATSPDSQLDHEREVRERTEERDVARRELEEMRRRHEAEYVESESLRRDEYGGFNWGAAIFGWLVAIALTVLLASIAGAIAAAVGESLNFTQSDAERQAGDVGIATGIGLLVVLMIAYFAGGYVAGRMSRYDGGRQGLGVWLIGVVVSAIAVGLGILFGQEYDIFDRVNLPNIPIPTDEIATAGLIALAAVLVGTLLAAFLGGKMGQRYHTKIDRITA